MAVAEAAGAEAASLQGGLRLELVLPRKSATLGEPIIAIVVLKNDSGETRIADDLLAPEYGFLQVWIRRPGEEQETPYRPVAKRDARGKRPKSLAPGESLSAWVPLYASSEGWLLDRPGIYRVRAQYGVDGPPLASNAVSFEISPPPTAADAKAAELMMSRDVGRLLLTGDDREGRGLSSVTAILDKYSSSRLAPFAQITLGIAHTQEWFDPATKTFRGGDCDKATGLLEDGVKRVPDPLFAMTGTRALARCFHRMGRPLEAERAVSRSLAWHPSARSLPGVDAFLNVAPVASR